MQFGEFNCDRMYVWICRAVVPIWFAPAPVSRTRVRNPAALRAAAYVSAAVRVEAFVMTSSSSPHGWTMIGGSRNFLTTDAFSKAAAVRAWGVSHGELTRLLK